MAIGRVLVLAGVALVAVAAALPAPASALTIKDGGKTLENKEIPLTGQIKVLSGGTGMECAVDMTIFVNGSTVDVTKFSVTTETCVGIGSLYAGCAVSSDEATLPWAVVVHEENLEFPSAPVDMTLKPKPEKACLITKNNITQKNVGFWRIDINNKTKRPFVAAEYLALATVDTNLGSFEAEVTGKFEFVGASAETYEFE
jgi:hypothetical protein